MPVKDSKIQVLLLGEAYHARMLQKQMERYLSKKIEAEFFPAIPPEKDIKKYDLIHLVSTPLLILKKIKRYQKPMIYHWIGSDVYRILNDLPVKRQLKKILIAVAGAKHFVVFEPLQEELNSVGISSTVFPLVGVEFPKMIFSMPPKFSVVTYLPPKKWSFHHGDLVMKLAEKLPGVDFHIVAAETTPKILPNLFFHGFVENMSQLYKKTSVLLRLTDHDGLSKMVLEALSFGRQVLWSQSFPHCHLVQDFSDCLKVLKTLQKSCPINKEGYKFVNEHFHPQKVAEDYLRLSRKILKRW